MRERARKPERLGKTWNSIGKETNQKKGTKDIYKR